MSNQFPGDFALREINLYSHTGEKVDIKALVLEINLYESILSSNLQATITLEDVGQNLITHLPIFGEERIEIIISSDGVFYNLNYYIYKIDGRSMKEKDQVYVISCVSIEALRNENFKICERIDSKKSEEIIKDFLYRDGFSTKGLDIDDKTVFPFDMYVPNWRPFDLFNWLSTRSVPEYKKDSIGYLFYETVEGFKFKSIDKLIDQESYPSPDVKYIFFQGNQQSVGTGADEKYRIMNYNLPKAFNIYDDLRRGAFAHACIYVDVNRATYRSFRTTVDDFWEDSSHMEDAKPYQSRGSAQLLDRPSRFVYRPSTISTWGNWEEIDDSEKNNIDDMNKLFEKAFFRYYFLEYIHIDIAVPGDLRNRVGNIINISIPDPKKVSKNRVVEDKRVSGRYMVSSIKHTILNRSELRTYITLSRDSYMGSSISNTTVGGQRINLDGTN
tara:strand:+ start:143 stop:1471 length:1329 start_codon:yes stop_codon:yes gene_type:complete